MKKFLIIIIFITGCSLNKDKISINYQNIDFYDNLSLEEFKNKLNEYASNSPFPNLDN